MDFLEEALKLVDSEYSSIASDGTIADNTGFIDTGSYTLNAILSGSIFGGHPTNKVTALAAESGVGKTFFMLSILKTFLQGNPEARAIVDETEGRLSKEMMEERGIDTKRVLINTPLTVEEFKNKAHKIIEAYIKRKPADRPPLFWSLDSLGMLPSNKEIVDADKESTASDMGNRAKTVRSLFRVLRPALSKASIPMLITNHVYKTSGLFPTNEMAGGGGIKYAADIVLMMGKLQDKNEKTSGQIIKMKIAKGWVTRPNSEIRAYISYNRGLHRYYGLEEQAIEAGIFKTSGKKIVLPGDVSVTVKELFKSPEKYYTEEILKDLDQFIQQKYKFGSSKFEEDEIDELE